MSAPSGLCALAPALLLLVSACGGAPRPRFPHTDPGLALTHHSATRELVGSIRAEARVDQRGKKGRIKGTVLMFVERPDRVRFDVMTQFGPAAILTSDGRRFAYADLRKKRFLTGPTCPENIARLLSIPMSVEETTLFLLGGTPLIEHRDSRIHWHEDGFYRVGLTAADGQRQEVDLAIREQDLVEQPQVQRLRLLRSELYDKRGKSLWRTTYDDFRPLPPAGTRAATKSAPGVTMPFKVRIEQASSGTDTLVRFKEIVSDAEIPPGAFTQVSPPGMAQEEASCE